VTSDTLPRWRAAWLDAALLFALGLAVRLPLLLAYPGVHGGDSVARLAFSDRLVLAYQLPLPQLLVLVVRAVAPDPLWTRLVFVSIGAAVAVALARVVGVLAGPWAGRTSGALAALHPLLVYYSLVPYQEGPMLLFLLLAADALLAGRDGRAGLFMGLACLCRYEAWIAAALAIAARRARPLALLRFGWAPALWMLAWRGLSPAGTYVLEVDSIAGRLTRLSFLLGKLREYSGTVLVVLALLGLLVAAWRRDRRWAWGGAYVACFTAVIVLVGPEFPPGSGLVSERLAHVLAVACCALAGLALAAGAASGGRFARARALAAALVVVAIGWPAVRRARDQVREANGDPSLQLAVALARRAAESLRPGERLAVAAPPVPAGALDDYVRKIERVGGDASRARALALSLAHRSPDATRIAAQLARPPATVLEAGEPAALVAVYDDAPGADGWRRGTALGRFVAGPRGVTLYRP
jgi:hypothetical protein